MKPERTIPVFSEKKILGISSSIDHQENLNTVKPLEPWKEYRCQNTTGRTFKNRFFCVL